ncbi:MAG: hypothetical protein H2212_03710 [Ruminococcus sp.]|nr:hypothetical protein [Ruminococcus sp.]
MVAGAKTGNIVREFTIGNTRIKMCDDYCRDKTREDVELILQRIARTAIEQLSMITQDGEIKNTKG